MNPQMFNSFLDGTKSGIEMAAVANATGLLPASDGLAFPSCGADDLPHILRPRADGGTLPHTCRSEEHTSELQSLMRISYAVFCLIQTFFISFFFFFFFF